MFLGIISVVVTYEKQKPCFFLSVWNMRKWLLSDAFLLCSFPFITQENHTTTTIQLLVVARDVVDSRKNRCSSRIALARSDAIDQRLPWILNFTRGHLIVTVGLTKKEAEQENKSRVQEEIGWQDHSHPSQEAYPSWPPAPFSWGREGRLRLDSRIEGRRLDSGVLDRGGRRQRGGRGTEGEATEGGRLGK